MDKLIFLIVIYYIFKSLFRFLSGDQGKKKETTWQPPTHPHRPAPSPTAKSRTDSGPYADFPSNWSEIKQVFTEIKRQAEGQKDFKTPHEIPNHQVSVPQYKKGKKDDQQDQVSLKKQMPQKMLAEETTPLSKPRIVHEVNIETGFVSFDQPGLFLQGIILSEVLRPPLARRDHFVPPYMRG
jgi:hypothetical protein